MPVRSLFRALLAAAAVGPCLAACERTTHVLALSLSEGVADTTISLRVGQEARVGAVLRFAFLGVTADSRCPRDVLCIWAGDGAAEIGVAVAEGPTVRYTLHTTVDPRFVNVGGFRLTLLDLQPYPVSTTTIPRDSYVAIFRLERLAYGPD